LRVALLGEGVEGRSRRGGGERVDGPDRHCSNGPAIVLVGRWREVAGRERCRRQAGEDRRRQDVARRSTRELETAISMQRLGEQLAVSRAQRRAESAEWFYGRRRAHAPARRRTNKAGRCRIAVQEREPRTLCCARARWVC
jgi:hypothetical protein